MAWIYCALRAGVEHGSTLQTAPSIISMFIDALRGCVDQGRHLPEQNVVATDRGKLSKAGWVRLRG
ncbi:hypothetical protein, partial [Stenotrophomonas maltophilia]|uniref:hypothetical protein n=1 Tax=Stenotrophomonas maltophilia TaxID=40324 RepID=UPI001953B920